MTRVFFLVVLLGIGVGVGFAAPVEVHFFWAATCPHCEIMKGFLNVLAREYPDLKIVSYEVGFNSDNWRLMVSLAEAYGVEATTTPVVVVGELAAVGIGRALELRIREEVERCLREACRSPLERLPAKSRWRLSPLERLLIVLGILAAAFVLLQVLPR